MIIPYIGGVRNAVCSLYIMVEQTINQARQEPLLTWVNARGSFLSATENEILGKECMKTESL